MYDRDGRVVVRTLEKVCVSVYLSTYIYNAGRAAFRSAFSTQR